ncbi:MAG: amidohydrolase family protein [Lachnospiraceae bacterium]|nr:amidohydrolase family protein [Lachnospiraceae bacterium]
MSKIYTNAVIHTEDPRNPQADTVVIDDGKFTFVGKAEGYTVKDEDEVIDLGGKFVIPGLIDSHQHWNLPCTTAGKHANPMPFIVTKKIEDALAQLDEFVKANPDFTCYKGMAGKKEDWGRTLTRYDLDKICSDKPFLVIDYGAHSFTGNSKLLEVLNVTRDTPDPVPNFVYYQRDENGEPTGLGAEFTQIGAQQAVKTVPYEDIADNIMEIVNYNISRGITGAYDSGMLIDDEKFLDSLKKIENEGKLKNRVSVSYCVFLPDRAKDAVKKTYEYKAKYESDLISIDTIKIFMDGTATEASAALTKPYTNGKTGQGGCQLEMDDLYKLFKDANEAGFDVHMHVVGDRTSKLIIDTLKKMEEDGIELKVKFVMAHVQLMVDDYIPELGKHNLFLNLTPFWVGFNEDYYNSSDFTVLPEGSRNYRYNSYWKAGAPIAFSSDVTVLPSLAGDAMMKPFVGIEIGMRRLSVGEMDEKWVDDPAEKLTLDQLLTGYTINGAKQCSWENVAGSIEVGKSADMVVLDKNLYEIPTETIHEVEPLITVFRGEEVYKA